MSIFGEVIFLLLFNGIEKVVNLEYNLLMFEHDILGVPQGSILDPVLFFCLFI